MKYLQRREDRRTDDPKDEKPEARKYEFGELIPHVLVRVQRLEKLDLPRQICRGLVLVFGLLPFPLELGSRLGFPIR